MTTMFYDKDADLALIRAKKVAIIGYGSQGHAHALNLKDSGVDVRVGLPPTAGPCDKAKAAGLTVTSVADAARVGRRHHDAGARHDAGRSSTDRHRAGPDAGKMLMFAHGFNIRFGWIAPPKDVDVTMIAPKAPGHRVRELYVEGAGTPALLAVHQDATGQARALALSYAQGHRRHARRRHRDDVRRGDRDRSVRRAGGALRRRERAGQGRLRDAGRRPATSPRSRTSSACTS